MSEIPSKEAIDVATAASGHYVGLDALNAAYSIDFAQLQAERDQLRLELKEAKREHYMDCTHGAHETIALNQELDQLRLALQEAQKDVARLTDMSKDELSYENLESALQESQQRVKELENENKELRSTRTLSVVDIVKENGRQQTALQELAEALRLYQDRMASYGEWDDGCFYYNNKSASELQEAIEKGGAALTKAAQFMEKAK